MTTAIRIADLGLDQEALNPGLEAPKGRDQKFDPMLDLQMTMTNTSLSHEYLRNELDQTNGLLRQQDLLEQMSSLKNAYYKARQALMVLDEECVLALERDLILQKQVVFAQYQA